MSAVRVLVVEDDPNVRGPLQTVLSTQGYELTTASDRLAGRVKVSSSPPDPVLLMMPDLGGVRVLQELRDDPEPTAIPVIVVTGKADAVPGMRALLGEDDVFLKPFAVGELLARVGEVTGGPDMPIEPS